MLTIENEQHTKQIHSIQLHTTVGTKHRYNNKNYNWDSTWELYKCLPENMKHKFSFGEFVKYFI